MQTDAPHDETLNENRELARKRWGGRRPGAGAKPRTQTLRDIDRAARLHDIAEHPYAQLAFADRSALEMMHLCAMHLVESKDYKTASRIFDKLYRYTTGKGAPGEPRIAPDACYVLAVADVSEHRENAAEPAPKLQHHAADAAPAEPITCADAGTSDTLPSNRDAPEPVAPEAEVAADPAPAMAEPGPDDAMPPAAAPPDANIDAQAFRRSGDPRHPGAVERNVDSVISTSSSASKRSPPTRRAA